MKTVFLFCASLMAITVAGNVQARVFDFTGPHLGGTLGYNFGSYDIDCPTGSDGETDLRGVEDGVFVGPV